MRNGGLASAIPRSSRSSTRPSPTTATLRLPLARVREAHANVAARALAASPNARHRQRRRTVAIGERLRHAPVSKPSGQAQLQASYEVDLFGRLADTKSAARSAYLASAAARDTIRLAVASATAAQYITLLGLDARLGIARQTVTARADSLRLATSRDRAGYSTKLELRQAEAEYDAAVQIVAQLEGAIVRLEDSLSQLVGNVPGTIARTNTLEALTKPPIPDGLPSQLLERRPDVRRTSRRPCRTSSPSR